MSNDIDFSYNEAVFEDLSMASNVASLVSSALGDNEEIDVPQFVVDVNSDLAISCGIQNGKIENVKISAKSGNWNIILKDELSENHKGLVGPRFKKLASSIQTIVDGNDDKRIRERSRSLIEAPLWAHGNNKIIGKIRSQSALSLFEKCIVIGGPGSGKTTLVKSIAALHSGVLASRVAAGDFEEKTWWNAPKSVLYFEWRELVDSPEWPKDNLNLKLRSVITHCCKKYFSIDTESYLALFNVLSERVRKGDILIIGDGLDEVTGDNLEPKDVFEALKMLVLDISTYVHSLATDRNQVIVTSRPTGLDGEYGDFVPFHLNGMESEEQDEFFLSFTGQKIFHEIQHNNNLDTNLELKKFKNRVSVVAVDLKRQPLFLTLLIALHLSKMDAKDGLPIGRGQLLDQFLNLLLGEWAARRLREKNLVEVLGCDQSELLDRLSELAYSLHQRKTLRENSSPISFNRSDEEMEAGHVLDVLTDLPEQADIRTVLDFIVKHAGILHSPRPKRYSFAHRVFQEYLAALWITKFDPDFENLKNHLMQNALAWNQVVRMVADVTNELHGTTKTWALIDLLLETSCLEDVQNSRHHLLSLAGGIICDQRLSGEQSRLDKIAADLFRKEVIKSLSVKTLFTPKMRLLLGNSLAHIGDNRTGVGSVNGIPKIQWCTIPAGKTVFGSSEDDVNYNLSLNIGPSWDFEREYPAFEYMLNEYDIAMYPVTVDQYDKFINAVDGYFDDRWWSEQGALSRNLLGPLKRSNSLVGNYPQTGVTWYEADAFAKWLSYRLDQNIRLPTELEWEKGARGKKNYLYPWGNGADANFANVKESGLGNCSSVGVFSRTKQWGRYSPQDMIGNVWEWCSTIFEKNNSQEAFKYPYCFDGRESDDQNPGCLRVVRGGYFGFPLHVSRATYRGKDRLDSRFSRQSFRLVRSTAME